MKVNSLKILMLSILLLIPSLGYCAIPQTVKQAYNEGNYTSVIKYYQSMLDKFGPDASIYYNMGNTYYKSGDIGRAILYYERAKHLAPSNNFIRHNLIVAQNNTVDKFNDSSTSFEHFLSTLCYWLSATSLMIIAITLFIIACILFLIFRFSNVYNVRKYSFIGSIVAIILCVFCNLMLLHQWYYYHNDKSYAIVVASSSKLQIMSPNKSVGQASTVVLHAGTKVKVISKDNNGFSVVMLPDATQGTIPTMDIEDICTN